MDTQDHDVTSMDNPGRPWVVLKFGGTSVSSAERWATIAEEVGDRVGRGYRVVVVCSALSQVSNRLEELLQRAQEGQDVSFDLSELRDQHLQLATELGATLNGGERYLANLASLLEGVRLTHEVTPRLHARVLSTGEMLSTRIGLGWLQTQALNAEWLDARQVLEAEPVDDPRDPSGRPYLSASSDATHQPDLARRLAALGADVLITQGFIARRDDETVLLGRGGSDTSAAYFAGKLGAECVEIWTDVQGMFTANPKLVPDARLLLRLPYREAEELALRGGKVLHPSSIRAAETGGVPVHVRCTPRPRDPGTVIMDRDAGPPRVHAVSARTGLVLVSIRVDSDWQPVGLIADLTQQFKKNGLSIDLMASSPTNLSLAIDLAANHLTSTEELEPLLDDLNKLARTRLIESAASISIVGTGIRALLHEWGEALRCFEDETVYLLSQSANDRSVSFVVEEAAADRLLRELHEFFFADVGQEEGFGPSWQELEACEELETVGTHD